MNYIKNKVLRQWQTLFRVIAVRDDRFMLSLRRAALVHGGVFDVLYAAVKDCSLEYERCGFAYENTTKQ